MEKPTSPVRPADDDARRLARRLLAQARTAALATISKSGFPNATRIAFLDMGGSGLTFVSSLSAHARALAADPRCALLVGEPPAKGDPLVGPRLSLRAVASPVRHGSAAHEGLLALWLAAHPKARLYAGFADFHFLRLEWRDASLNGGFGKAHDLTAADLGSDPGVDPAGA